MPQGVESRARAAVAEPDRTGTGALRRSRLGSFGGLARSACVGVEVLVCVSASAMICCGHG